MNISQKSHQYRLMMGIGLSLLLALVALSAIGRVLAAEGSGSTLGGSAKTVDRAEAMAGQTLQYTVLISHTDGVTKMVHLQDALPAAMTYQSGTLTMTEGMNYEEATYGESGGVITWTGTFSGQGHVALSFEALLADDLLAGTAVTNTAVISTINETVSRTATTTIIELKEGMPLIYFPLVLNTLAVPDLQLSVPVDNQWVASWNNLGNGVSYELQEATSSDFANATVYDLGVGVTSQIIIHNVPNVYFYRVRGVADGRPGPWSDVEVVLIGSLTLSVSRATEANNWDASWTNGGTGVVTYELQEAHTANFVAPATYLVSEQSRTMGQAASPDNYYCYRVRSIAGGHLGDWSNTACTVTNYWDDFSDDTTGWAIRRQDRDDVDNKFYYKNKNGEDFFVLEIDGRWDYGIASPLRMAPQPPYAIESRVRLNEQDNLNAYGFIFGGDWDGTASCPNNRYNDCFHHYYRLMFLWYGAPQHLRMQLKRIDFHDSGDNGGDGETLISYKDINVGIPPEGFKTWRIVVEEDGLIKIYVNGEKVAQATDDTYIHNPYFGVFAATDEYLGAEPWYDWYSVTALDE